MRRNCERRCINTADDLAVGEPKIVGTCSSDFLLSFSPEDENVTVIELDVASLQLSVIFAS